MLIGNLELCDIPKIVGWVADQDKPLAIQVCELRVNGRRYSFLANEHRADLSSVFKTRDSTHLRHGFSIDLEQYLKLGDNTVELKVVGDPNIFHPMPRQIYLDKFHTDLNPSILRDQTLISFPSRFKSEIESRMIISSYVGRDNLREALSKIQIIFVLFSNRSGSNLVTEMLENLELGSGATNEPFLAETIIAESEQAGFGSVDQYMADTIVKWSRNGYCFLKMSWDSLSWLISERIVGAALLDRSAIIITTRKDKILQAISYLKVLRSGKSFTRAQKATLASESELWPPVERWHADGSYIELAYNVHNMFVAEQRLRYLLSLFGLKYHEIVFEQMVDDFDATNDDLRVFLEKRFGVCLESRKFMPSLVRQSSVLDTTLKVEFLKFLASPQQQIN